MGLRWQRLPESRRLGMLFAMILLLSLAAAASNATTATEAFNGRTVRIEPGTELRLALSSNATTGYSWNVVQRPRGLKFVSDSYDSPRTSNPLVTGAGGMQQIVFRGVRPGSGELKLIYTRPWARKAVGGTFRLKVVIGGSRRR
jgi:inhibitor of cysteine peptidase